MRTYTDNAGLHNLLGAVQARRGEYGPAESSFKRAIELASSYAAAYENLGRLYLEHFAQDAEGPKKALETYRQLLKIQPANIDANYQSAFLLEREGSYAASLAHLARLPAEAQEKPMALAVRCADLAGLGKLSEAEGVAARLIASPELVETDVLQILPTLEKNGRVALHVRLLEGLVARGLASPPTLARLGHLYAREEKLDRARETLENAATSLPNPVGVLLELARVAQKQQDRKGALGYLAHARDLDPQNAEVHFFFGIVCIEENLAQEAYASLEKAVRLNPDNPYYHYAYAAVALQRESPREAVRHFQKYCELKPADPRGKLALGVAYFNSGEYASARKVFREVAKLPQTAAGAHYYLGRLANLDGNYQEALHELEQALRVNSDYANAHAEMGVLYLKQRNYAEAEKALTRAVDADPDNYPANYNLLVLFQRTKDPRAEAQAKRFEEAKKKLSEKALESLRSIEVRPYVEP